jgi:hypothetical protein
MFESLEGGIGPASTLSQESQEAIRCQLQSAVHAGLVSVAGSVLQQPLVLNNQAC